MTGTALLVAAPRSGSGKTTVTMGLIAALRRRGRRVRAIKCGPDYIDPAFHQAASGAPCPNIDSWAMSDDHMSGILAAEADRCDILIIEAAMGLFDGVAGQDNRSGAAADIARRFDIPVLLVIDIAGQAQSAGAVARGFAIFDPSVRIGGIILNNVASDRHLRMAAEGLSAAHVPLLAWFPRRAANKMPERHLGLVQARERGDLEGHLAALADQADDGARYDDIEAVATCPGAIAGDRAGASESRTRSIDPPGQRIAVAQDDAFTFLYAHLVADWRNKGAEIMTFSPLDDEPPPDDADCCWLPGGYPELHAGRIAGADGFLSGLRSFAENRPIHGECGGYMVLGQTLQDADGKEHRMAGLLSHSTSFKDRRLHLGYRRAVILEASSLGPANTTIRGHEFHYSTAIDDGRDAPLFSLQDGEGRDLPGGSGRRNNVSGSYFHAISVEV